MDDISDIFWDLQRYKTEGYEDGDDNIADLFETTSLSIIDKDRITCSHYQKYGGEIKLCLGEARDDGVACAVGGELWEASSLLSCFMMFHFDSWRKKGILELGSGVGIPGLFAATLKSIYMELCQEKDSRDRQCEVDICMTDYDSEVLGKLTETVRKQFSKDFRVESTESCDDYTTKHGVLHNDDPPVRVQVSQLDWTRHTSSRSDVNSKYDSDDEDNKKMDIPLTPKPKDRHSYNCEVIIGSELVYTPELSCVADVIVDHMRNGNTKEAVIFQMRSRTGYTALLDRLGTLCTDHEGGGGDRSDIEFQEDDIPQGLYDCASLVVRARDLSSSGVNTNSIPLPGDEFSLSHPVLESNGLIDECVIFPPSLSLISNFHKTLILSCKDPSLGGVGGGLGASYGSVDGVYEGGSLAHRGEGENKRRHRPSKVLKTPSEAFSVIRIWKRGHVPMSLDVFNGVSSSSVIYKPMNPRSDIFSSTSESGFVDLEHVYDSHPIASTDLLPSSVNDISTPFLLRIGTFNIHNARRNLSVFVDLFLSNHLNVIVLQECSMRAFKEMEKLLAPHGFLGAYSPASYEGNGLFTSVPISRSFRTTSYCPASGTEMRSAVMAVLQVPICRRSNASEARLVGSGGEYVEIGIAGMHLSHVREKDRERQIDDFLSKAPVPCIIVGDLNALLKSDYSPKKWDAIAELRKRNRWQMPETSMMNNLTTTRGYRDSWQCARESTLECPLCSPNLLSGQEQRNGFAQKIPIASTCRFDTRIDWILLPPIEDCREVNIKRYQQKPGSTDYYASPNEKDLKRTPGICNAEESISVSIDINAKCMKCSEGYRVVDTMALSDHKMVVTEVAVLCRK